MSAHKNAMSLATATLMDIIARGKLIQAAKLRDASGDDQELIRADAHALLDAYLDQMAEAGAHVRGMLQGHPDAEGLLAHGIERLDED